MKPTYEELEQKILELESELRIVNEINVKNIESLKEKEETFRRFMDNFPGVAYIKDKNFSLIFVNNGARKYFDIDKNELLGKTNSDLFPKDTAEKISKAEKSILESGSSMKFISTGIGKNINKFLMTIKFAIPQSNKKNIIGGLEIDITDRILAENALKESEERFRTTLYSIADAIIVTNSKGIIINMNPIAEKLTGWLETLAKGKYIDDVFNIFEESTRNKISSPIDRIIKEGNIIGLAENTILISREGKEFSISNSGAPIYDSTGKLIGTVIVFNDISKQKQIEKELILSEERYRTLYEHSPLSYQSLDENGYIIEVNQTWLMELGYTKEEVIGKWFGNFLIEDEKELFRERFPKFVEKGETHNVEFNMVKKNGDILLASFNGKIGYNADGSFKQTHCVFHDITERKYYENALRDSEQRYRNLIEINPDGIALIDLEGKLTFGSDKIFEIFEIENPKDAIGHLVYEYIAPEDRNIALLNFRKDLNEEKTPKYMYKFLKKGGELFFGEISSSLLKDNNGKPIGLISVIRDITGKVLAEEALKNSELRFRNLAERISDIVVILNENALPIYFSPSVEKVLGYKPEELLFKNLSNKIISEKDFEKLNSIFKKKEIPQRIYNFELTLFKKNNQEVIVESKGSSIYIDGNFQGAQLVLRDITERKIAEQALKISEERFRSLYNQTPAMLHSINREGILISVSDYWLETLGYERNEVIGRYSTDFLTPESRKYAKEKVLPDYMKTGLCKNIEYQYLKKSGEIIDTLLSATAEFDSKGNVVRSLAIVNDISELKKTSSALKESDYFLIKSQEIARLGSYVFDINMGLWNSSKIMDEIFGIDDSFTKSVVGWIRIIHPEDRELMVNYLQDNVLKQHQTFDREYRIIRINDNQERRVHGLGELEFDNMGNPIKMFGTIQDITERKIASSLIGENVISKEQIDYFDLSSDIQIILNKDGNILKFNPEWQKVTGYNVNEFIGKNLTDFVNDEDIELTLNYYKNTDYFKKDNLFINRIKCLNGSYRWLEWKSLLIGDLIYSSVRDITNKIQNEKDLLKAKEKAEKNEKYKTIFLANISHEIRSQLNGIVGFSRMLNNSVLTNNEREEYLNIINQNSGRLLEIVNSILDISQIETGELTIKEKIFNLNSLMNQILSSFTVRTKEKDISLIFKPDSEQKNVLIKTDEFKLNQIFYNLIENAVKFTEKGSITFGYEIKDDKIEFFVKDTGIGIPKEYHKKVFKMFQQLTIEIIGTKKGLGLGLAIAKGFVETLGGKIRLESETGKGSAFYFTLPYKPVVNQIEDGKSDNIPILSGKTKKTYNILLAEDDESNFRLVSRMLQNINVNIIRAKNGEEAVEICKKNDDIEIVLMDIKMPLLSGYDATKLIKSFKKDLPVIAITAYAMPDEREKSFEVGCDDYIPKPIDFNKLFKILEKFQPK